MTKKCTIKNYFWSLRSISKINILNCIVYLARKDKWHVIKIRALLMRNKFKYGGGNNFEDDLLCIEERICRPKNENKLWNLKRDKWSKYFKICKSTKIGAVVIHSEDKKENDKNYNRLENTEKGEKEKPRKKRWMDDLLNDKKITRMKN